MSYCVHCGVELAPSERDCPLCGTRVMDPACDWQRPAEMPYPETVDIQKTRIDRRYARQLMAAVLMVPAFIVLLVDLVDGWGLTWSLYVVGGLMLFYCWLVVPVLFKFSRPYAYIIIDVVSLWTYLLLIALLTGGMHWLVYLVLPLLALMGLLAMGVLLALRRQQWPALVRTALICAFCGLFLIGLELLIGWYLNRPFALRWSFYAAIPLGVIALMLLLLDRNKPLKQEIKKRLFI
ncbi:MAG: zinc ribbon domain-containing protein [Clostridiales bacterium]|nr:zinc ribbon domain-containing protein [Clostridiales bacterium]